MNKHDSERIAGYLSAVGFTPVESPDEADVVVINTCAVRENAVKRLKGYIRSLGRNRLIAVGGCVAQVEKERLLRETDMVQIVFGPDDIEFLPQLIGRARRGSKQVKTEFREDFFASQLPSLREKPYAAWLAITKGCDNYCTYCIVPFARGKMRSRLPEDILEEAERLRQEGVIEITLLGQNVNSYGTDIAGQRLFGQLLEQIARMGFERVGFATSHPRDFDFEIVDVVARYPNISRQIHIPVQSGSNRILKLMNRGYTRERYIELADYIRERVPDAAITTDVMVGFPGETDRDFADTLDIIRRVGFEHVFTFIFSPRPGTEAARMENQVPEEVKKERFDELVRLVKQVALEKNRKLVGQVVEAIVEGPAPKGDLTAGRTPAGRVVLFRNGGHQPGDRIRVKVEEAGPYHLTGTVLEHR